MPSWPPDDKMMTEHGDDLHILLDLDYMLPYITELFMTQIKLIKKDNEQTPPVLQHTLSKPAILQRNLPSPGHFLSGPLHM